VSDPSERPEILVIGYECSPDRGSESGAGFSVLRALTSAARCTVLVGTADAEALERFSRENPELELTVVPVPESALGNALYRLHHYTQFVSYLIWLRRATPRLRELAASGRYRVAWHVSYSPGWLPSPLRDLDLPTVWGPCTGADRVPGPLRGALSRRSRVRDVLDNISTWIFARLPSTRRSRKSVDLMLLALDNPSVRRVRPGQPTEVFIQTSLVDVPAVEEPTAREDCLYFVSPLRAQKGPLLAIEAAARTPGVRLVVAPPQRGQMRAECERIVRKYGAESRVTFVDGLSRPEMLRRLRASKGFVHSALSDVASMALAEALVIGVPVVALDVLGSKTMKSYMTRPEFMPLVAVHDPEQVITDLGQRMLEMLANEDDFPTAPLLDQPALERQFVDYIDTACEIHEARHAGKGKSTGKTPADAIDELPAGSNIVQLLYSVQDRGGEAVAYRLGQGFRARGYPTHNIGMFRTAPISASTADFEILGSARPSLFGNVRSFISLVRVLRRERPTAVIMHGDFAQIIGAPAAMLAGVRQRIVVNHLAIGIFYNWLRPIHTVMGVLGFYRHIVFVGESARRDADGLPKRFLDRSTVIPNTVGTVAGDRAAARARYGIADETTVLLNVGNLSEQKNQQILITAMADIPDAMLVIAGDGPLSEELQHAARVVGERVRLLGRVPIDEIADIYSMADVFVFPSRYEGRPLALLEAATAGLPILATPIPENVEVVGTAAQYIDGDDVEGWIDAMQRTVKDREYREQLAAQTRRLDVGSDDATIESYLRLMI
jgi:glycosyltransferase involved in cell wall biosynthesis